MTRVRWCVLGLAGAMFVGAAAPALAATRASFREDTQGVGIRFAKGTSYGAVWADYDLDGDPDLFVNRHYIRPRLFVNSGGQYTRHEEDFINLPGYAPSDGGPMDRHGCAWGEANGDRIPELLCTQGADRGTGSGPNQLIFRSGDGFVDRASRWTIAQPEARGRTVNWFDYDRDGDLDLFLGNAYRSGHPNKLFRNTRERFVRVRRSAVRLRANTLSSTWSDWDNDGDPDLLVTFKGRRPIAYENRKGRFRAVDLGIIDGRRWTSASWGDFDGDGRTDVHLISPRLSVIARNMGGRFRKVHSRGLASGRSSTWLDVDNDGDLDLFIVQGRRDGFNRRDFLLVREGGRFVPQHSAEWSGPSAWDGDAVVAADSDLDGDVDLFVTNGHANKYDSEIEHYLYINETTTDGSISVQLAGRRFNPWAYGARIKVRAGTKVYKREITDGVGYRSQSGVGVITLGIGSAPGARVTVSWPWGARSCIRAAAGATVRIGPGTSC